MKHGLALLAAGLVLLVAAVAMRWPPEALLAAADGCLRPAMARTEAVPHCALPGPAWLGGLYGDAGMAVILLIGGMAALACAGLSLRAAERYPRLRRPA